MLSAGTSNPVNYNVPALICTGGHMWSALDKPAIVYEARSKKSGNRYIGITGQTLERRKYQHAHAATVQQKRTAFAHAIRKYGVDGLEWSVLSEHATMQEAIAEEKRLVRELRPKYNETMGGQAPKRRVMSPEQRRFLAELHRGNTYRLGATHTPEVRAKLRDAGIRDREKWLGRSHLGPAASAKRVLCLTDGVEHPSASAAARAYGIQKSSIIEICSGYNPKRKTAGGRRFRYV